MKQSYAIGKGHPLTKTLVDLGYSVRDAHTLINVIFDVMKDALKRHEDVELPFGSLRVIPQAVKPYRRWRFNRPIEFYQKQSRVVLVPAARSKSDE